MREKRGADRRLEVALEALRATLVASRAPWMVIGGIAIIARGVRRMTTDIDAVVRGDAISPRELLRVAARHKIVARIPDAESFAATSLVLLLRHVPTGVDLDVSFAWTGFELDAIEAGTKAAFGRVTIPTSTPADLIVLKAIAGRPRDVDDIAALIALYPNVDLAKIRARVSELAELVSAPELVTQLDEITSRARTLRRAASKPKRSKAKRPSR